MPDFARPASSRRRFRLPIAAVLVAGFGTLVLLAVASVLVIGLVSAGRNTFALLNDKADLALAGVEVRIRHQLDPAAEMTAYLGRLIEQGALDPGDELRLEDSLRGALAGAPDVTGLAFITPDQTMVRVARVDGAVQVFRGALGPDAELPDEVRHLDELAGPIWTEPLWSKRLRTTFLVRIHPVWRDGRPLGAVLAGVSLADLSRFLSALFVDQGINAFVLYDNDHVLAHPSLGVLKLDFDHQPAGPPLPGIEAVEDAALAMLWTRGQPMESLRKRTIMREVTLGGTETLFLMRTMAGYGRREWTVGIALPSAEGRVELQRLYSTAMAGLLILGVSVGVALVVGRRISRQVGLLAEAAEHIRAFEFREVKELPDSSLRELSRAAQAFNAMVAGLMWFETYVPKALVLRLMRRRGGVGGLFSEERAVTVMFTDIRGFSRLAENLGAADTASLLNDHFTMLGTAIEDEGGTVDKFIGDAIMAFWGAPEEQGDHARRALAAAVAIQRALHADNRRREADGLAPIRLRIGLHSGPAVVGNIGSANRINYTIVGDTVNVASRIEELASSLQGEAEVIVLASAATAAHGDETIAMERLGDFALRGRGGTCEIWRLGEPAAAGSLPQSHPLLCGASKE